MKGHSQILHPASWLQVGPEPERISDTAHHAEQYSGVGLLFSIRGAKYADLEFLTSVLKVLSKDQRSSR